MEKPTSNKENNTEWSFENDETHEYDQNHFNYSVSDEFVIKEATHIYVTQQRIHHFFKNKMQIEAEDIQKFVYMLQYGQAWHLEQVYEFTMKLRSNKNEEANIPIDQSEFKIRKTPSVKGYRTKTEQQLEICDQAINLPRISNKNGCLSEFEDEDEILILPWTLFQVDSVQRESSSSCYTIYLTNILLNHK
ncbi:unnamed protein product, partial [Rotaria sp. Silwood2]